MLVVDLAAVEDAGLTSRQDALKQTAQLMNGLLPFALTETKDPALRQLLGRFIVATAALRDWTEWPRVRGFGMSLPELDAESLAGGHGVMIFAVDQSQSQSESLLVGIWALGRAVFGQELGKEVRLERRGNDACVVGVGSSKPPYCVRAGPGFFLVGQQEAMNAHATLAPVAPKPGAGPRLMQVRLMNPESGTFELAVRGRDTLEVTASAVHESPMFIAKAEQAVQSALREYDQRRAQQRELLAQSLSDMQRSVSSDAEAPAELKTATAQLTVDKILDPDGYWQQVRQSVKVQRGPGRLDASLVVPPGAVGELRELVADGGGGAATMGMLAAVAIPNFVKFNCRSKQSEAKANLKALFVGQRSYAAEHDRYGSSFKAIGFRPEGNTRYAYCMGQECLTCTHPECRQAPPENPCTGMSGVGKTIDDGFQACAYANLDDDADVDVWIIDDSGRPQQGQNDCE